MKSFINTIFVLILVQAPPEFNSRLQLIQYAYTNPIATRVQTQEDVIAMG